MLSVSYDKTVLCILIHISIKKKKFDHMPSERTEIQPCGWFSEFSLLFAFQVR